MNDIVVVFTPVFSKSYFIVWVSIFKFSAVVILKGENDEKFELKIIDSKSMMLLNLYQPT